MIAGSYVSVAVLLLGSSVIKFYIFFILCSYFVCYFLDGSEKAYWCSWFIYPGDSENGDLKMSSVLSFHLWITIPINHFQKLRLFRKWVLCLNVFFIVFSKFLYALYLHVLIFCWSMQDDSSSDNSSIKNHLYQKCLKDVLVFLYTFFHVPCTMSFFFALILFCIFQYQKIKHLKRRLQMALKHNVIISLFV